MVSLASLWLPILLSAVLVFVVSAIVHMVLGYHRTDFSRVPEEEEVMAALRQAGVAPGEYAMPYAASPKEMGDPAYIEKFTRGPVAFLTVAPSGPPAMGRELGLWFVYCLVVGLFAAYIASRALEPGEEYLEVFRFTGTVAFVGYVLALWQNSIWFRRKWSTTLKSTFDGLVYALLTGGVFGWLWPG